MFKNIIKRKIFTGKKSIHHPTVKETQTILNSRLNIINHLNKETEPMNEEEVNVSKMEVRVLYKKCLACNFIVPWEDAINECADDPECPGNKLSFVKGRDPEMLIHDMSDKFAEALVEGDREGFMEHLKTMVKDKNLRDYVFDVFANSIEKIEEKTLEKSMKEAPI